MVGVKKSECLKEYNDREEKIRLKKIWDDEAPQREAERQARIEKERIRIELKEEEERIKQKKWDDEAPQREALIAENEALIAKLKAENAERNEKLKALEIIRQAEIVEKKIKFPFGEWFNCQRCNVEKKEDFERKYKWCKKCGNK